MHKGGANFGVIIVKSVMDRSRIPECRALLSSVANKVSREERIRYSWLKYEESDWVYANLPYFSTGLLTRKYGDLDPQIRVRDCKVLSQAFLARIRIVRASNRFERGIHWITFSGDLYKWAVTVTF